MNIRNQKGQTLIETIVAIFMLTTALTAGLGLAIYALSSSANNTNQVIATNLAREGIEVVRGMRDSNWLAGDALGGSWDLQPCLDLDASGSQMCYPRTYQPSPPWNNYDIVSPSNRQLQFTIGTKVWNFDSTPSYNMYLQNDGSYTHTNNGTFSTYARAVVITQDSTGPDYTNQHSNWELKVRSVVAWRGKGCTDFPTNQNLDTLNTKCKITLEERLTNWKDYK